MVAAAQAIQRPADAKLLAVDRAGGITHMRRSAFPALLRAGDLVVANDAGVIPASLRGIHEPTGETIEIRLAGRRTLGVNDVREFTAIVFGAGDYQTPTEKRPAPPPLTPADRLILGPLRATVVRLLNVPRLIDLRFNGTPEEIWEGLAHHGEPIQYAHVPEPLALWDVWTPIAGPPVAFEPPSAGFALDWRTIGEIRSQGAGFATITHAAGISSTGDPWIDSMLPFDEPYRIPAATASAIRRTKARGGRLIAIGTTVVRALEHAGRSSGQVHSGAGLATQQIGPNDRIRLVDAILSGTHEPDTSHYQMLRAFADDSVLDRANRALEERGYKTHEFGDSVFIERGK